MLIITDRFQTKLVRKELKAERKNNTKRWTDETRALSILRLVQQPSTSGLLGWYPPFWRMRISVLLLKTCLVIPVVSRDFIA